MKRIAMLAASVLVAVLAIGSPAHAAGTGRDYAEARTFLASFGASAATQDRLIKSLQAGEEWDALSSENDPVSTVQKTKADGLYTINTYRDGSISVLRIEALGTHPKNASTKGVSGCSVSGKVRSNCLVDMWVGLVRMSFRASYNLGTNKVTRVYGPSYSVGGSCSTSLISLGRPASNIGRMDIQAQACVVGYSTTFFLQLKVSGGKTRVTWDG